MNARRTMCGLAAATLALSMLTVADAAHAGPGAPSVPASLDDNGPIFASAEGSLLTLELPLLSPAVLPATSVDLARSVATADSDADLDPDRDGAQRSAATAGTTGDTAVLGQPLALQETTASAPQDQVNRDVLIPLDASPLLDLDAIRTSAEAHWLSDVECVAADTPMSRSDQSLADLAVLMLEEGQSVVELDTDDEDGAVDTEAETSLVPAGAPGLRAVQARTTTAVTSANVLNDLAGPGSAIQADVVQSPDYTVQATGLPGGATVTGEQPVVNVAIGDSLITLDQRNETGEATITDLVLGDLVDFGSDPSLLADLVTDLGLPQELADVLGTVEDEALVTLLESLQPVARVSMPYTERLASDGTSASIEGALLRGEVLVTLLESLQPVARVSMPYTEQLASDGTSASVEGALLRVEVLAPDALPAGVLDPALEPVRGALDQLLGALGGDTANALVHLDLAPFAAAAQAPAGGVDCGDDGDNPLRELNKHASATEVAPGSTFDYSISVPNRGSCTLTDLVVTDVVTGPGRIVGTEPQGTVDGNTVRWELGELAPGDTAELTVTVQADADAPAGQSFDDAVTAAGDCGGRPVEQDDRVDDIPTVATDFSGSCDVSFSNTDASHEQVMPGQTFAYYVHAFNTGAEPCTDVVVTDTLDDRLAFVSCSRGCTNEGREVTWTPRPSTPLHR